MAPDTRAPGSLTPKRRRAVTDLERRNIRRRSIEFPGSQSALILWFYSETGHQLNQSQISKILSTSYIHLDNESRKASQLESMRRREGDWPVLEEALFE